jgi:hypothetical protein
VIYGNEIYELKATCSTNNRPRWKLNFRCSPGSLTSAAPIVQRSKFARATYPVGWLSFWRGRTPWSGSFLGLLYLHQLALLSTVMAGTELARVPISDMESAANPVMARHGPS